MNDPIQHSTTNMQMKTATPVRSPRQHRGPHALLVLLLLFVPESSSIAQHPNIALLENAPPLAILPKAVIAPSDNATTAEKVRLGNALFFDPRLSGNNTISCATCHAPDKSFADGSSVSTGIAGKKLTRNSPSLLNTGFYDRFFWDGRAASLEEQALIPIQTVEEMHQDLAALEEELNLIPEYVEHFQDVFNTPVTREGIGQALAAFQRTLVTQSSPFDRYLAGDETAISADAKEGLRLFRNEAECIRCHNGPFLTDGKFYRLGISRTDRGRGLVTGNREDDYKFRTPTLRNVADSAPYMHNGSIETLDAVVTFYYREVSTTPIQGLPLDVRPLMENSYSDIPYLVAFLRSLSGDAPKVEPIRIP